MKKTLTTIALSILMATSFAQVNPTADEEKNMKSLATADSGWTMKGGITVGITGSYFNQWAAGGINSLGINGILNYGINYRKGKNAWDNTIIAAYGLLNQGFTSRESWIKTDDRLDLTSKYGRSINSKLFYAALVNFNTQFAPGYAPGGNGLPDRKNMISNLLAPARVLVSLGLDYKPNADLSVFFSPITYRGIYVMDDLLAAKGAFGVKAGEVGFDTLSDGSIKEIVVKSGESARHEVGAYMRVNYAKKFNDNATLTSKLELFSNYLDKAQNVDLAWETILAVKLFKNVTFTTSVNFLYDDNTTIVKTRNVEEVIDNVTYTRKENYNSKGLQTRVISTLGFVFSL